MHSKVDHKSETGATFMTGALPSSRQWLRSGMVGRTRDGFVHVSSHAILPLQAAGRNRLREGRDERGGAGVRTGHDGPMSQRSARLTPMQGSEITVTAAAPHRVSLSDRRGDLFRNFIILATIAALLVLIVLP